MTETTKDQALLERARGGDHGAFLLLYERHRSAIFRFLYRLSGSIEVAEDITHDSFLTLIRAPRTSLANAPDPLRTQLYSTARNLAIEYFRHTGHQANNDPVPRREQPLNSRSGDVSAAEVRQAVLSLPPLEREALIFSEYEGLKLSEIATIVGADVETLTARLERARYRLGNTLAR